jgi:hypothetical protein
LKELLKYSWTDVREGVKMKRYPVSWDPKAHPKGKEKIGTG